MARPAVRWQLLGGGRPPSGACSGQILNLILAVLAADVGQVRADTPDKPRLVTNPRRTAARDFPEALTHLALISAAFNLGRALGA